MACFGLEGATSPGREQPMRGILVLVGSGIGWRMKGLQKMDKQYQSETNRSLPATWRTRRTMTTTMNVVLYAFATRPIPRNFLVDIYTTLTASDISLNRPSPLIFNHSDVSRIWVKVRHAPSKCRIRSSGILSPQAKNICSLRLLYVHSCTPAHMNFTTALCRTALPSIAPAVQE